MVSEVYLEVGRGIGELINVRSKCKHSCLILREGRVLRGNILDPGWNRILICCTYVCDFSLLLCSLVPHILRPPTYDEWMRNGMN